MVTPVCDLRQPNAWRSAANALTERGRAAAATKDIRVRQQQRGLGSTRRRIGGVPGAPTPCHCESTEHSEAEISKRALLGEKEADDPTNQQSTGHNASREKEDVVPSALTQNPPEGKREPDRDQGCDSPLNEMERHSKASGESLTSIEVDRAAPPAA
jgi:hypothetical protein